MIPPNEDEIPRPMALSLGLAKKDEPNDLEEYMKDRDQRDWVRKNAEMIFPEIHESRNNLIENMKSSPELYFNFGFTYEDFKAFLMKIMYCRAMRRFIERKRIERIDEYNRTNQSLYDFQNYSGW